MDKVEARWKIEGKLSAANISLLKQTRASFGTKAAEDVTVELLTRFVESRLKDGYAVATANRQIQLLRRGFHLLEESWPKFELPREDNRREGFFTPQQMKKLLAALPSDLADFAEFCYATGMRKGQAAAITWNMIQGDQIIIPAQFCKSRKPHTVPLAGPIKDIINHRRARRVMEQACVFHWNGGEPINEFRDTWKNACIKAGCGNLLFHDLRRSAVRDLIRAGVSQATAMSISGHRTISIFQRYDIVTGTDQREALERVSQYRAG